MRRALTSLIAALLAGLALCAAALAAAPPVREGQEADETPAQAVQASPAPIRKAEKPGQAAPQQVRAGSGVALPTQGGAQAAGAKTGSPKPHYGDIIIHK